MSKFLGWSLGLLLAGMIAGSAPAREHQVLLGTYTGESRGIYAVGLNGETGALSEPRLVAELPNPEFLALHPNGRFVYAATQVDEDGRNAGAVAAFALDRETMALTPLNRESTGRSSLVHLAVDASGQMLVTGSYGGGYVASFPLAADGRVGRVGSLIDQVGPLGPDRSRQDAPHPHSFTIAPDNGHVVAADLGIDRVFAYALTPAAAKLAPVPSGGVQLSPGAGPRHTVFSRDGKFLYVLNELDGTVSACRYRDKEGRGEVFQHLSTSPDNYSGRNSGSEIRLHPNQRFLYAANRGHNGIAVFARDEDSGALRRLEIVPTGGENPRNFALSPDGAWLLCANQNSHTLTVFKVDANTGRLTAMPHTAKVARAVCVLFVN